MLEKTSCICGHVFSKPRSVESKKLAMKRKRELETKFEVEPLQATVAEDEGRVQDASTT